MKLSLWLCFVAAYNMCTLYDDDVNEYNVTRGYSLCDSETFAG